MKLKIIAIALVAALGTGCATPDKKNAALQVQPLVAVRHGAPNAQAHYQLGRYYQGQRRLEQAEKAFLLAIAADDNFLDAYNALGSLYAERGELQQAVEMFEKVTAMAPDAGYLYNNLGLAHYLRGDLDNAYGALRRAVTLDGNLERAWANLEVVARASRSAGLVEAVRDRRLAAIPAGLADPVAAPVPAPVPEPALQPSRTVTLATPAPAPEAPALRLVTAEREVSARDGLIELAAAPAAPARIAAARSPAASSAARVEVANGNGITGLARRVGKQVGNDGLRVTRVTNQRPYGQRVTVIQYQPGFAEAAKALAERLHIDARCEAAPAPRAGADLRVVLGRDAAALG